MNILLVTKTLATNSGIGRYSLSVYDHLRTSVHVVRVLSEDKSGELLPNTNAVSFVRNCLRARRFATQAEIVHALDVWPYGVYARCAVFATSKRLFVGGVGTYSVPPGPRSWKRALFLWVYARVQGVLCISEYTKKRITSRVPFSIPTHVVHLATNPLPEASPDRVRAMYRIPEERHPIFLTVGEVKERKGQLDTLKGLVLLKEAYPQFLYIIVGSLRDTSYISLIKDTARTSGVSDRVLFLENVSDEELASLYALSDVFCLNSNNDGEHFEGFGLVFLEAAQFGVAGIGSRECGIEDAIADGVSGILVPQKNHEAIAEAARRILKEKASFEKGARNWYTHFSWSETAEAYLKIYTQL